MRSLWISATLIGFSISPVAAEIGCDGLLAPTSHGFYAARIVCTNTEKPNQGYQCSGNWRLIGEDDQEHVFPDPVSTVPKGEVDFLKRQDDRVGGMKIKGQAHPYEGKCEL